MYISLELFCKLLLRSKCNIIEDENYVERVILVEAFNEGKDFPCMGL